MATEISKKTSSKNIEKDIKTVEANLQTNELKKGQPILKVKDLNKTYKTKNGYNKVVNRVSFQLQPGKILGLIGESGSGKTTTGRTLIRLVTDFSGLVQIGNDIVSGDKIDKKSTEVLHKNMQMIFQNPYSSINPLHNVYYVLAEALNSSDILNDVMKDIKKDYTNVMAHFELDFKLKVLQIKYKFYEHMITYINKKYMKFNKVKFMEEILAIPSPTQAFSRMSYEWNILVGNIYQVQNNLLEEVKDELISFYKDKMAIYRAPKVNKIEIELEDATNALNKATPRSKFSGEYIDAVEAHAKAKKAFETEVENIQHLLRLSKQTLASLNTEYKNDINRYTEQMKESSTPKDYNFFWVKSNIVKLIIKAFKDIKWNSFYYLSFDDINSLKDDIDNVKESIITLYEKEKIKGQINTDKDKVNFIRNNTTKSVYFVLSKYLRQALINKGELENKYNSLKAEMDEKHALIPNKKEAASKPELDAAKYEEYVKRHNVAVIDFNNLVQESRQKLSVAIEEMESKLNDSMKAYNNLMSDSVLGFNELFITMGNEIVERIQDQTNEYTEVSAKTLNDIANGIDVSLPDSRIGRLIESQIMGGHFDTKMRQTTIEEWKTKSVLEAQNIDRNNARLQSLQIDCEALFDEVDVVSEFLMSNEIKKIKKLHKVIEKDHIYRALDDVGLPRDFAYRYSFEMSGGQLQRVAIARALISDPKIIIADEPIASLDISIQAQIVNLLRDLAAKKGISIIFIAHDLAMVENISDEVLILHRGKIVECGDTVEIFKNPVHPYTKILFGSISTIENANKPFEKVDAQYTPDREPSYAQRAMYYEIAPNHVVFGLENQVDKWVGNKKHKKLGDYVLEGQPFELKNNNLQYEEVLKTRDSEVENLNVVEDLSNKILASRITEILKEDSKILSSHLQKLV